MAMLPFLTRAQDSGIRFDHSMTWQQVKARASAEKKYIYVDCFATWCGPCKMMSENIFPKKEAGDFFNSNFINVKLQLDQTKNDDEYVRSWYADGKKLADDNQIRAMPTALFFNPDGEVVYSLEGAVTGVDELISIASAAKDPEKQYYPLIRTSAEIGMGMMVKSPLGLQWEVLQEDLLKKYPRQSVRVREVLAETKVRYYDEKGDRKKFTIEVKAFMNAYGPKASPEQLNAAAWGVFRNCTEATELSLAIEWSKRSLERMDNPAFIDTYANLLYKSGKKEDAIHYEERAVAFAAATEPGNTGYKETLDKMMRGEKTWE